MSKKHKEQIEAARKYWEIPTPSSATDHIVLDETATIDAKKYDAGKTMFTAAPMLAIEEVSKVMTYGANSKYGKYNYLTGNCLAYSRLVDAAIRHLIFEFWKGTKEDKDTGLHPLAHAACCILMLLEYELRGKGLDDRLK